MINNICSEGLKATIETNFEFFYNRGVNNSIKVLEVAKEKGVSDLSQIIYWLEDIKIGGK